MSDQAWLGLRIFFWVLAAATLFLPMRWAVLGFIIVSHIDITTSAFDSATSIGPENAVRSVVLPTVLFLRFSRARLTRRNWNAPVVLWLLLTLYAATACTWSPFELSGAKMTGYMYCYLILGAVFLDAWKRGLLTPNLIAAALWCSLGMAALQTYVLGNEFGKSLPGLHDDRFTSFCSPQLFGAFLLAMASILLVTSRQRFVFVCINGLAAFSGIVLCGSRYVFLGFVALVIVAALSHIVRQPTQQRRSARLVTGMLGLLVGLAMLISVLREDPDNRISQFVTMVADGKSPLDNIGTLVWRRGIYDQAWGLISHRGPIELMFGSGTSSGALAVLGWDRRYSEDRIDANRVIHNELLRVTLEWGIFGLGLFVAFMACLVRMFWRVAVHGRVMPAYAFLGLVPAVILGCCSENILAGSASPAGVGFLLSMMYGISYTQRVPITVALGRSSEALVEVECHGS